MYRCQAVVRRKYDLIDLALSGIEGFRNLSLEGSRFFKRVSPLTLIRKSSHRANQWGWYWDRRYEPTVLLADWLENSIGASGPEPDEAVMERERHGKTWGSADLV